MKLKYPKELKGKSICFCQVGQLINIEYALISISFIWLYRYNAKESGYSA